jgi:uncharacterized membrane protein
MVALWTGFFGERCWRQHSQWASLGFDTGIYDQGIWLLSRRVDPFMTIRGMDHWGHHVAAIDLAFAVAYRFGAGIHLLTAVHTAALGLGAVPLWLLARDRWGRPWLALVAPAAYLLHPAVHWVAWWLYHPDSFAITPLLFAWWLATRRRWGWFAVAVAVALSCKEDLALAVAVLGLVLLVVRRERRAGALTLAAGVAWFLVCTRLLIPWRNHHAPPFYASYFPALGASAGEILRNSIVHPSRPWRLATRRKSFRYLLQMGGPYGIVLPLVGLVGLVVAVPQLGVNLLVQVQDGATIRSQYASLPIVGASLGMVEGMGVVARRLPGLLDAAAAWLAACAIVGSVLWGLGPVRQEVGFDVWTEKPRADLAELARARDVVPPTAAVSVAWTLDTHFTHRRVAYEFPNPWVSANYGPTGNDVGDPAGVDWVVVDRVALGTKDLAVYDALTAPGGGIAEVFVGRSVRVAHRVAQTPALDLSSVPRNLGAP